MSPLQCPRMLVCHRFACQRELAVKKHHSCYRCNFRVCSERGARLVPCGRKFSILFSCVQSCLNARNLVDALKSIRCTWCACFSCNTAQIVLSSANGRIIFMSRSASNGFLSWRHSNLLDGQLEICQSNFDGVSSIAHDFGWSLDTFA